MPEPKPQDGLTPSLLDRLIDPDAGGTRSRPGYPLEQMLAAVKRDLEDLLNTRQTAGDQLIRYPELAHSLLGYGLPDLISLPVHTPHDREVLCSLIQQIITSHEHRLKDVKITLLEELAEDSNRSLKLRIEARLRLDPAPEVAFETILELMTGRARVKAVGG
jgi:type VI secretion system protein ImpF